MTFELSMLMDHLYEGIYIVDLERKIISWNKAAEQITGFKADEVIGKYCHDNILNHIDAEGRLLCLNGCPLHTTLKDGVEREAYLFLQHKKGYRIPVKLKTVPIFENEVLIGVAELFQLNDEVEKTVDKLLHDSSAIERDAITGLPMRAYMEQFLAHMSTLNRTLNLSFGIILVDIDSFEEFNNTYGKRLGDDVLKIISKTFTSVFGHAEMIGRWRQDEFLFVFSSLSKDQLFSTAETIRMLSEGSALRNATFKDVDVTVSIGATHYLKQETIDNMIMRAYDNLKASKRKGGNLVTIK